MMENLDAVVAPMLGASGLGAVYLGFRFLEWIRRGRVDDAETAIKRLTEAVERERIRANNAEAAEDLRVQERDKARELLYAEREYTVALRSQLRDASITPVPRTGTLPQGQ